MIRDTFGRPLRNLRLSVTDRGPGIPEGDRKHVVERFVRLEASRTLPIRWHSSLVV